MCLLIRKKYLYLAFCTFLLFLCFFHSSYLFAQTILTPELFRKDNIVITEEVETQIRSLLQEKKRYAYLTFDDGPNRKATEKILNILEKKQIKANFFVIGKCVEELPELVKREYQEGHFIANHSYSHQNQKLYESRTSFLTEIVKTDNAIAKAIGIPDYRSHLFRFPNGSKAKEYYEDKQKSISYLKEIDYTYLDWNALNHDSMQKYTNFKLLQNLKDSIKGKETLVILMHDTADVNPTYEVLEDSIDFLLSQGYEFRTFYDFIKGNEP